LCQNFFVRKELRVFVFRVALLSCAPLCSCSSGPDFMPAANTGMDNFVEITNIGDYEKLVKENKIKTVFYTDEYFIARINAVLYVLKSRGYKNFHDYKEGRLKTPEKWAVFKPGYPLKREESGR